MRYEPYGWFRDPDAGASARPWIAFEGSDGELMVRPAAWCDSLAEDDRLHVRGKDRGKLLLVRQRDNLEIVLPWD